MHSKEILERIQRRLAALDMSESEVQRLAKAPDAIRNLRRAVEEGRDRKGILTSTLNALAPVLKTTAVWLFAGAGPEDPSQPTTEVTGDVSPLVDAVAATWIGFVEAGRWGEVSDFTDLDDEDVPIVYDRPSTEYPGARVISATIRGSSMNALEPQALPHGTIVTGLDFEGLRGRVPLRPGMILVVQRSKDGGHRIERSIKQLEIYSDRFEFHPRSNDPKHEPIIQPFDPKADDGVEVSVLAWITGVNMRLSW